MVLETISQRISRKRAVQNQAENPGLDSVCIINCVESLVQIICNDEKLFEHSPRIKDAEKHLSAKNRFTMKWVKDSVTGKPAGRLLLLARYLRGVYLRSWFIDLKINQFECELDCEKEALQRWYASRRQKDQAEGSGEAENLKLSCLIHQNTPSNQVIADDTYVLHYNSCKNDILAVLIWKL